VGKRITKLTTSGINQGFHEALSRYKKLRTIATPSNFIVWRRILQQRTKIILTTQMSKAFCHFKTQFKQIIDVTSLQLGPSMTILFILAIVRNVPMDDE
jgi:hypothetical protein